MQALIKKSALIHIISAAAEVFKKECFLILLGNVKNGVFIIENAMPMQTAKRDFDGVKTIKRRFELFNDLIACFWKHIQVIGDCHSHTEIETSKETIYPIRPSQEDRDGSSGGSIYLIIGVGLKKKTMRWKKIAKKYLSGTLGKYRFEIRAYWAPENKKLKHIEIICPTAYRLNAFKK